MYHRELRGKQTILSGSEPALSFPEPALTAENKVTLTVIIRPSLPHTRLRWQKHYLWRGGTPEGPRAQAQGLSESLPDTS